MERIKNNIFFNLSNTMLKIIGLVCMTIDHLYLYVFAKKTQNCKSKYICLILLGCVAGIAYKIKVTTVIFVIALFIEEFLNKKDLLQKEGELQLYESHDNPDLESVKRVDILFQV